MTTLIHSEEKQLLSTASRVVRGKIIDQPGWLQRLRMMTGGSARYDRLDGWLRIAEVEIGHRIAASVAAPYQEREPQGQPDGLGPRRWWHEAAVALLSEARSALSEHRIDRGWKLLQAARRMEIFALDAAERHGVASALREESTKLRSWRQKAVEGLLGTSGQPKEAGAEEIALASLLRDEHYDNQGYKDQLLRTHLLVLALILASVLGGLMWVALGGDRATARTFVKIGLFGLLGATVSAMLRASDSDKSARIPELTAAIRVTLMRILMGSASAIIVYVLLRSQLKDMLSENITKLTEPLQPYTTYAVAFVAGFSERLVLRAVEKVAGKDQ